MKKKEIGASKLDTSLKLLVRTSFIVFIGVALSKILLYVYRAIVARYYGPEVYGLFSLAIMVSGWFIAVSALGLSEGIIRFIPLYRGRNENHKIKYIFKFTLAILTVTGILSGLLLFLLSDYIAIHFFHNPSLTIFLKIFSVAVPLTVMAYPFLGALRAFEKISWYSFIFNVLQNLVKVAFLALFVVLGMNSNAISFSYLLGMFGMLVVSYLVCRYKLPGIFGAHKLEEGHKTELHKEVFSYSIPLLFFAMISTIFYWIDSFSLGYYRGALEVGFYNAAVPIAALLAIAPELFVQLFFPMITREYARKNLELIEQLSKQVAKWILIINIPVFAILIVFPGAAINILFGAQYLVAENALRILSIGALISAVLIVSNYLISMMGKSKLVLMNMAIAAVINLLLNSIFVPMQKIWFIDNAYGLNGAALATLISVIIFNVLFVFETYKYLSIIPIRRKMLNLFIIAIIPTALLFYLRTAFTSSDLFTLAFLGIIFILVYISLIFVSKSLDENDWKIIKSIWNKLSGKNLR